MTKENKTESKKESELDILTKKVDELTDSLKRKQAEFENYQKRMESMASDNAKFAAQNMLLKLFPVVDNFELSFHHMNNQEEFVNGIKIVHKQLLDILTDQGVEQVSLIGQEYDPSKAQALQIIEGEKDNVIVQELEKCYTLHDKVIRQGKVIVSKKAASSSDEQSQNTTKQNQTNNLED